MPLPVLTKSDIVSALRRVKIQNGDLLYITSFTAVFGNSPTLLNDSIAAFMECVGRAGTLIMPTFNWDYCHGLVFNPKTTPSQVGILTEVFRKRDDVKRTEIPPWCTFAVSGSRATEIAAIKGTSSFGKDSVLEYLYDHNAKYVLFGCNYEQGAVQIHWLEEKFQVPYRSYKDITGTVEKDGVQIHNTARMYARDLTIEAQIDPSVFHNRFDQTGPVAKTNLGLGTIRTFMTRDYVAALSPHLERDRLALLTVASRERFAKKYSP